MLKLIKNIELSNIKKSGFTTFPNENFITDFKQINVFIGGNNSGKSRFLRLLIEDLIKLYGSNKNISSYIQSKETVINQNLSKLYELTNEDIFNKKLNTDYILNDFWKKFSTTNIDIFKENFVNKKKYDNFQVSKIHVSLDKLNEIYNAIFLNSNQNVIVSAFKVDYTYIPILRGLKPLNLIEQINSTKYDYKDIYANRVKADYPNVKKVFTGLEINEEVKKRLLGDEKDRSEIKAFEDFISKNLFLEHITLIPKYDDNILNIKIGNEAQRSIVDLGDGLQALICILFPIFMEKNKEHYFFIEEPELNLHPLLQKKLISLLSEQIFNQHQYFISTHSAHIIDHENASIYNFTKEDDKTIITHLNNQSKIVSALNIIGYTPSDLLQTNYIVWVEGETDKMIINHLIKKFYPSLKENHHYSIMFYGGSGDKYLLDEYTDFELILVMNRNCAVIKDSDKTKASDDATNKENKFNALEKLGVLTWLTPKREIENHISQEDFIKAIRIQQNNELIEIVDSSEYGDWYTVRVNNDKKKSYSPNRYIYLSQELFNEVGKRKGNLKNSNPQFIIDELQKSITTTNEIFQISRKISVVEVLIKSEFDVDEELSGFIHLLCSKIKLANQI